MSTTTLAGLNLLVMFGLWSFNKNVDKKKIHLLIKFCKTMLFF
ncbi:BnaC08g19230D [Brassica napus]|uniref:BnaC08g19230D protein n=1 Tax=Brassica napus TaxID=3708 RepID=A0A078H9W5_BRANA|nr:BnaC08g19230D [Brassica napus]